MSKAWRWNTDRYRTHTFLECISHISSPMRHSINYSLSAIEITIPTIVAIFFLIWFVKNRKKWWPDS